MRTVDSMLIAKSIRTFDIPRRRSVTVKTRFCRSCLIGIIIILVASVCPAQTRAYTETVLYNFCAVEQNGNCLDGSMPAADLIQGMDGNLYGTTQTGGAAGLGTFFK